MRKERIFSFRDKFHQWDPKNQRPELWDIYNARVHEGESIRVFPLSNWTELDIWQYIRLEEYPDRSPVFRQGASPCVEIDGNLIMADDDRLPEQYRDQIRYAYGPFPYVGLLAADRRRGERGGYDRENRGGDDDHDEERAYDPCDRLRSRR